MAMKRKVMELWGLGYCSNCLMRLTFCGYYLMPLIFFILGFSSAGSGANVNNSSNHFPRQSNSRHPNNVHANTIMRHGTEYLNLNLTFIEDFERNCPQYCVEQSHYNYNAICIDQGCKQWKTGLRRGCSVVCNGTENNIREHYGCQVGCTKAIEDYYVRITGLLGVPDPPSLILDSLKSTSLQLSWEGSSPELPYLVFTIQRRVYHRSHQWETIPTQPLNQTFFTVQGLKPYTEYQFRIGWILAQDFPPFYSSESRPIETLPQGLPNPPEITSIQAISNTSVSVTWIPPSQPNGRLVAYILKLNKHPHGHAIIKEIPIFHNPRGYTFSGLSPNTNYSLAISAQNLEGEGDATTIHFVTPQSSMSNDISKRPEPRLLLQGAKDVYIQQVDLLLEPDVTVYAPNQNITAIAAHIKYKWVFIATGDGQVVRTSLERNQTMVIFPRGRLDVLVFFMSVDWLHNKLYMVGKKKSSWIIMRCELGGEAVTTIYRNLGLQPVDFMADPFTGYLYWVNTPIPGKKGGLYKMEMLVDGAVPEPVIETDRGDLGPFTVDFINYRILIVHRTKNTVLSVSLNGDVMDIRRNARSPQFGDVLSIGTHNGIFYWTTGHSVVIEEYNRIEDSFYHNSYDVPKNHLPCSRLMILHPDLQPVPVPMAPPLMPEVVMGTTRAIVSWRPPAVIAGLGKDAWTDWKYQIVLSDNISVSNISGTQYTLKNLRPSASYLIQVQAYSPSGRGPLSLPVRARTLRKTAYNISLLWASQSGIYKTDALGENVQLLVSPSQWSRSGGSNGARIKMETRHPILSLLNDLHITSLAWHDDSSMYYSLSNGSVFHYQAESQEESPKLSQVFGISYAQSIAFDYIGQKIYWANPKKQTISRCGMAQCDASSENVEWLPVVTMAKEIVIDSFKAILFWTTGHSLEMARLNGYSQSVLYQTGLFSGVQIMGITLDTDQSKIYLVTRSSAGSTLQRLDYHIRNAQTPTIIANFDDVTITGPIRYFNDRLLWLQGSSHLVLTDVAAQSRSSLTADTINNVTSIHVRDQSVQRYPGLLDKSKIQVVPNTVPSWSVKVSGQWNNFTISWQAVNNTNYGKVFYEIIVNNIVSKVTQYCNLTIETSLLFRPYTEIEITLTAVSYWSSSKPISVKTRTPSTTPSEPRHPKVYVDKLSPIYKEIQGRKLSDFHLQDQEIKNDYYGQVNSNGFNEPELLTVELRWDAPLHPNGKILGYLIMCWKNSVKNTECLCHVDVEKLRCEIQNLRRNSTYQFAVQAYTDAGAGNMSSIVTVDFDYSNPLPQLLLASSNGLEIFDIDRNTVQSIFLGVLNPLTAVYLAAEESVFWINEGQDLMKSHLYSGNKTRVLSLSGQGEASHLAIDWIGKVLFWVMEFPQKEDKFAIMSLDLSSVENMASPTPATILTSTTPIKGLTVNPFKNQVLWTTSKKNGVTTIFSSKTDGLYPTSFLSRDHTNCNCSNCTSVGESISFDSSGFESIKRGVLITNGKSIYLTDENGCNCIRVVNSISHDTSGKSTPPYKIAGDKQHVYWSAGYLYASEKPGSGTGTELMSSGIREISVVGPGSQPFPDFNCLIPTKLEPQEPLLFNHSSHSLHLRLPKAILVNCSLAEVSKAAFRYKVFYGNVNENGISECTPTSVPSCRVITTSEGLLHINGLFPYTTYTVFVTVTNIYAEMVGLEPLACSPIMLRTAPGAPMPPKLLRLEQLTPATVRVVWRQPDKLNGEKVWYEVHWQPEKKRISPGPGWLEVEARSGYVWSEIDSRSNENRTEFHLVIKDLNPGCNYSMWVVAFSEKGDAYSVSENKTIRTYQNPNNITLVKATPHTLNLRWTPPKEKSILRHQILYRVGWTSEWNSTELMNATLTDLTFNFTVTNLKPKTMYGFKIKTWYETDPENPYVWPREGYGQFGLETLADKPGAPGQPIARGIGKSLYEVSWDRADENGAQIEIYSLECRMESNSPLFEGTHPQDENGGSRKNSGATAGTTNKRKKREWTDEAKAEVAERLVASEKSSRITSLSAHWIVVFNSSEPRWQAKDLDMKSVYVFRVRAKNLYGWGDYSKESTAVSLASLTMVAEPQSVGILLATITSAILVLGILAAIFAFVYHKKLKEKPTLQNSNSSVELATLRELPPGIHQSNILYAASDLVLDLELAGVPQIRRHQISFTKFLGSGAFGEVYEGIAVNLPRADSDGTRVAIKTLRKGASMNEKLEFIQEAKLMTQFRHPHIIQLLGLCIDTDPCCLLLELMDGGDLLSYLRSNRPHLGSSVVLHLVDLLKICLDVAKGCVYLEDMHFVHRDLAARNCLVRILQSQTVPDGSGNEVENPNQPEQISSRRGQNERVVKIGDFGLARDVYSNDYYRKEGEGLLPVRWMAPESLIDGVYTTQSDVWSFGVLLWEIMTLGQQPYPARNNLEVMHYVRAGGRPLQPLHCPDRLSELMMQCWEFNADNRPTFKDCCSQLEFILGEYEANHEGSNPQFSSIHPSDLRLLQYNNYLQPGSETKSNYNRCGTSENMSLPIYGPSSNHPRVPNQHDNVIYTENASFPKYLEIISELNQENSITPSVNTVVTSDEGYEIPLPRKPPRNPKNAQLVNRLASKCGISFSDSIEKNGSIGLPPPPYWNTASSSLYEDTDSRGDSCPDQRNYYINQQVVPFKNQQYTEVVTSSPPISTTNPKLKAYMNTRKLGLGLTFSNGEYELNPLKESPSHFRNLLASNTSDDADMSESDFGSPLNGETFRDINTHLITKSHFDVFGGEGEQHLDYGEVHNQVLINSLDLQCNPIQNATNVKIRTGGRLPVSLSDSGIDAQGCCSNDEVDGTEQCGIVQPNETLHSQEEDQDLEYLSMCRINENLNSQINLNHSRNNNIMSGYLDYDEGRHSKSRSSSSSSGTSTGTGRCASTSNSNAHTNNGYCSNGYVFNTKVAQEESDLHCHYQSQQQHPYRLVSPSISAGSRSKEPTNYDSRSCLKISAVNSG